MKQIDLHGKRLKEAEEIFHTLLNQTRMTGKNQETLFITGTGPIQEMLKKLAKEQELNAYVPMANRGCIVVEFE